MPWYVETPAECCAKCQRSYTLPELAQLAPAVPSLGELADAAPIDPPEDEAWVRCHCGRALQLDTAWLRGRGRRMLLADEYRTCFPESHRLERPIYEWPVGSSWWQRLLWRIKGQRP